ncbi:protein OBERON 3 [Lactuca sativa]|uniref:Oberon PHD finger domain-containing protein n=1 Tax=Lactuca sativa TaxID=4236 RepID=A0A9R1UXX8_LACSA|nr:protein OBERON 3 [Lactuca sativa]KAJ0194741.1 hypothetical protein LSAT_V11C700367540 [Lactuca sativa]
MEIDPPHESDGSTTGSKENEMAVVFDSSGIGLPYAPEDFPLPGDKWGWKVGKRVGVSGHFIDRYLYLPDRLHKENKLVGFSGVTCGKGFASKASLERYLMETFPGIDINAFFSSFTWKIQAANIKGNKEIMMENPISNQQFDPAGCKAGNINCSSLRLLETNNPIYPYTMPCDICCVEPYFCHDCCCILCSRPVNSSISDYSFIKCEAMVNQSHDFICGHICHIECGLRSYMAGTVGGTIGLDAEYSCRRCDARTDLVPHVEKLLRSCESICDCDKVQKILNLCIIILRGSTKASAMKLFNHVQSAVAKLKEGNSHEDIWKREDMSAVTTGDLSQYETDTFEVSNFAPSQRQISFTNFDYRIESMELEKKINKTLASLKKSQETEYKIAENALTAQKTHLLDLYKELEKQKGKLANCSPSTDPSLVHAVFKKMEEIKTEFNKIIAMQVIGKGFGKTSKYVLKEHFGMHSDN